MSEQIVTVFRSRLHAGIDADYEIDARRMDEAAAAMPGYVDHKTFVAEDGERVTIVTFADQASHDAWAAHPEHRSVQRSGRERYYATYQLQVARVIRTNSKRLGSGHDDHVTED